MGHDGCLLGRVVAAVTLGVLCSDLQAQTLGLQFSGWTGDMTDGGSAGLEPSENYNVVKAWTCYPGTVRLPTLHDAGGIDTTVAGSVAGFTAWAQWDGVAGGSSPNHNLYGSLLGLAPDGGPATLTFGNLNTNGFAHYDLIVYLTTAQNDSINHRTGSIAVNGGAAIPIKVRSGTLGPDVATVAFTDASITAADGGNYFRARGLTNDTVSVALRIDPLYPWSAAAGVAGIQIVQAAPASLLPPSPVRPQRDGRLRPPVTRSGEGRARW